MTSHILCRYTTARTPAHVVCHRHSLGNQLTGVVFTYIFQTKTYCNWCSECFLSSWTPSRQRIHRRPRERGGPRKQASFGTLMGPGTRPSWDGDLVSLKCPLRRKFFWIFLGVLIYWATHTRPTSFCQPHQSVVFLPQILRSARR